MDEKDLSDREVRSSIQASLMEFPVAVQLWLSTRGFFVEEAIRQQATLEQQDASIASQIEELLPYGSSSEAQVADLVASFASSLDRPSPLYRAGARVALQGGDMNAATQWIERGLEQSVSAGLTYLTLALLQERAWLDDGSPREVRVETLKRLADYAERHRSRQALLQHRLQTTDVSDPTFPRQLSALEDLLDQTGPQDVWGLFPAFRPAVAGSVRLGQAGLLRKLRTLMLAETGPFRYVVFPDPRPQATLDALMRMGAEDDGIPFGHTLLDLFDAWPYRILFVQPLYGRGGEALSEESS